MKRKIISIILIGIVSLSLIGCSKEDLVQTKTISGTIIDSGDGGWKGRFKKPYYIKLKTDNGEITLNCNEKYSNAVNNGLKVNISYDGDMFIRDMNFQ